MKKLLSSTVLLALAVLAGCAVGPKYRKPAAVPAAPTWKTEAPWAQATPSDSLPKGAWWSIFNDPTLNEYEGQLLRANQSLFAAQSRLQQARALARVATAGQFPQLNVDVAGQRQRISGNRPLLGSSAATFPITQNNFAVPFSLNYEVDLFGRVRRNVEAANASLQATAADLQNVQLVLTAELAADYFSLRELDSESNVLNESVAIEERGLQLVENRHNGGVASGLEVAQQATLLDSTRTQFTLVRQQRAQFEHAIAVLTGQSASSFSVPVASLEARMVPIPLGVPSDLLERRPDIATSERQMAFQNAQVGIATSAFYPRIMLSGGGGYQSRDITTLVNAPSAVWAFGADILQPIFNGGRNRANLVATRAAYDESIANYRQNVLVAFQEVEDALSGLSTLNEAWKTQAAAVADAQRALTIANNRYVGGVTTYLDVITAQANLLTGQRLATQLLGQQMVTSVYLVKALGGGWDASTIQNEQVHAKASQVVQQ
jgi:NodT family efflux transporter outer membrane factor (OMF) lipoprotein